MLKMNSLNGEVLFTESRANPKFLGFDVDQEAKCDSCHKSIKTRHIKGFCSDPIKRARIYF